MPRRWIPGDGREALKPAITTMVAISLLMTTVIGCSPASDTAPSASGREPLVVFLVRHAEKTDHGEDPELSPPGVDRAAELARSLRSAEIDHVHSSDFIRTRDTAAPTAAEYGLEVELYDPDDLLALVEILRKAGGRHLVVGHSNTTPQVVELLGGEPGPAINEEGEFDRLYIVTIGKDGTASSVMTRYGRPYEPDQL